MSWLISIPHGSCPVPAPRTSAQETPRCSSGAPHAMVFRDPGRADSRLAWVFVFRERCRVTAARQGRRVPMAGLFFEEFEEGQIFEHAMSRTVTEMDNVLF